MIEWDDKKNSINKKKHGVSFELASLVFDDPFHMTRYDRVEGGERRYQTLGEVQGVVLVLVAHTWEEEGSGETIRIISARPATKRERKIYEQDK